VLCRLAVRAYRWMLQHPTLFAFRKSGGFLIASSGSTLIDVSIYFDKDSSISKAQMTQ
jgi:hypothetical protein